jgi:hypothetical protein
MVAGLVVFLAAVCALAASCRLAASFLRSSAVFFVAAVWGDFLLVLSAVHRCAHCLRGEAADLQQKALKAELAESQRDQQERDRLEQQRRAKQLRADRAAAADRQRVAERLATTEEKADRALRELAAPKPEKLRVLMLGASPEGDLRIGREQDRIRKAVEAALHRDQIEFDLRTAATPHDLLDGIAKFRPHVVHFSGHSGDQIIGFEENVDEHHDGVVVTADAFASACAATDTPPTLVVFNSCESAATADAIVQRFAPLAIGMSGTIDDVDAIHTRPTCTQRSLTGNRSTPPTCRGKQRCNLQAGNTSCPTSRLLQTSIPSK